MKVVIVATVDDVIRLKHEVDIPPEFKGEKAAEIIKAGVRHVNDWFYENYPIDFDALLNDDDYSYPVLGISLRTP